MTYRDPKTGRWATKSPSQIHGTAQHEPCHTVFVYGTLKQGHGNWQRLLKDRSTFVGHAQTADKFSMVNFGAPVVFRVPAVAPVRGEVYRVSDRVLSDLDRLEGFRGEGERNNYDRAEIDVLVAQVPEPLKALIYLSERPLSYRTMMVEPDGDGLLTWAPRFASHRQYQEQED